VDMDPLTAQIHGRDGGEPGSDAGHERRAQATARDEIARARDLAALARDESAELRDRELGMRDATDCAVAAEDRAAAAADREDAARDREHAARDREDAARDREHAARDREDAARDRLAAQGIRDALLRRLRIAETDKLTGTRTRAAGLSDIDHEIDRARRTRGLLVAAYVDVVGLKVVNDAYGHAAGDALLQRVVRGIRSHLRSYDVIVRLGGDEFLCAMPGATIEDARQRFGAIQTALAADSAPCQIKFGFAELGQEDSTADLIGRADAELPISPGR
jgi:diguanylate cyclase (GGDEF)-like protein